MLNNLRSLSPDEIEWALASLIQRFLPQPRDEGPETLPGDLRELQDSTLAEIQARLGIEPADQSAVTKAKILEFLAKELSEPVLRGARGEQAKIRLGQRGDLRLDLYKIEFDAFFHDTAEKRGIRKNHVEYALRHPDEAQHILPGRIKAEGFPAVSLYAKHHGDPRSTDRFTLLVQTERKGYLQHINSAWRVYHSDVNLSQVHEPLDILRAFVDVYGLYCRVNDSAPTKLFFYEAFPLAPGQQPTSILKFDSSQAATFDASFLVRVSPLGVVEIALAYVIDSARYMSDLRRHNVQFYS
jgi:hypothetical protein